MNLKMIRRTEKILLMTSFEDIMNNEKDEEGENMRLILMTSFEHLRNDRTLGQQERSLLFNDLSSKKWKVFTLSGLWNYLLISFTIMILWPFLERKTNYDDWWCFCDHLLSIFFIFESSHLNIFCFFSFLNWHHTRTAPKLWSIVIITTMQWWFLW